MEIISIIKNTLSDDSMSEAQIKFWYQCFKLGREFIESQKPENAWAAIRRMAGDCARKRTLSRDFKDCSTSV